MLNEAHRRAERGADVVVAWVETHGRLCAAGLLAGLEVIPRAIVPFEGKIGEEFDLAAVLARRPEVALLDDFGHSNTPGSRHGKRWQDVEELLAAGIDVISTVNIQQLDSLHDVVEKNAAVPDGQTVPDAIVRAADEIELVDMAAEALQDRVADGDIYPAEQAQALAGCFGIGNLSALRELALRWLAAKLAEDRQRSHSGPQLRGTRKDRERVVVALAGRPEGERLIRRAARIADRVSGDLLAVHVSHSAEAAGPAPAVLAAHRRLVQSVGGTYHQLIGDDIPAALLTFARAEDATQLLLGTRRYSSLSPLLAWAGISSRVIRNSGGIDVHIVSCTRIDGNIPETAPARGPSLLRPYGAEHGRRALLLR